MKVDTGPTSKKPTDTERPILFLAFALGIVLPIDVLGGINPALLDALRYGLALLLIIMVARHRPQRPALGQMAVGLLAIYNLVLLIRSQYADEPSLTLQSAIGIASAVFAYLVVRSARTNKAILAGFLVGASLSATDILLQVAGLAHLGTTTEWGNRYPGLSFSSTNTAPFLAIGAVIALNGYLWAHRPLVLLGRWVLFVILGSGLLLSGGRGGLAGLLLALMIYFVFQLRRQPLVAILLSSSAFVFLVLRAEQVGHFLTRGGSTSTFTTGRVQLNAESWQAFLDGGVLGIDLTLRQMLSPHTPILSFALDAGVLGLVVGSILTSFVAWRTVRAVLPGTSGELVCMIAAIILVTSMLEPIGFFVGFAKACLLMIVLTGGVSDSENDAKKVEIDADLLADSGAGAPRHPTYG